MSEQNQRLLNLSNSKLMDVVKNYRQYGFDDEFRKQAIAILEERGVSLEYLKFSGNFENKKYDYAKYIFKAYRKNSIAAFLLYLMLFVIFTFTSFVGVVTQGWAIFIVVFNITLLICYIIFLIKSFMNQNQFYKILGKDYGSEGALIYLFFGMPLYVVMYFYFSNQMRQKLKEIQ